METLRANLSTSYDVIIDAGILEKQHIEKLITSTFDASKILIITDKNLEHHHLKKLLNTLNGGDFKVFTYVLPVSEKSKSFLQVQNIVEFLAENNFSRKDILVAFGGGAICDLTGFCASIYMRGIPYMQIPTSILAAIDASVGGKTAINLSHGKNLVGSFYQPSLVICDPMLFKTLTKEEILNAYGEMVKYAILSPKLNLNKLDDFKNRFIKFCPACFDSALICDIVSICIRIKLDFIENDEKDLGQRQFLNLGHTIAHAIETISRFNYPHGKSVAYGIFIVSRISLKLGFLDDSSYRKIQDLLSVFDFSDFNFDIPTICKVIDMDKKITNAAVNFILPKTIGEAFIYPIKKNEVEDFLCLSK